MQHCVNCLLVKGSRSRKFLQGTTVAPDFPFQVVYADLISGLPKNKLGYTDILTIVCPLSKFLCTFGLKNAGAEGVISGFKTFFAFSGFKTQVIYTDNGAAFRKKSILSFMATIGITLAATTVFHSQARGQIEIFNYLLEKTFCLLYTSPSPRDRQKSRMPSSA